jgi:hypothetical protein
MKALQLNSKKYLYFHLGNYWQKMLVQPFLQANVFLGWRGSTTPECSQQDYPDHEVDKMKSNSTPNALVFKDNFIF